ncbi:hypothetical protein SSP531S_57820 [Streptomyces spongiicola]|uniref:Histidine kinase/HSP90-like ATPase domain-containing protein n=3 Tax=Streptomyces spongiicola TaxID=1690221 RepID=A0A388T5R0_9ACTN|nr:hypothetical protein SSP531S_57820 [Streptomyces spongiicola]
MGFVTEAPEPTAVGDNVEGLLLTSATRSARTAGVRPSHTALTRWLGYTRNASTPRDATMTMTAATVGPQRYQERYAARLEAAAQARRDITLVLETWGLPQLVDVAEQVVTELVANAVEHTDAATVGASITRTGTESARIVVTDTSRTRPTPGAPSPDDEHGRGLLLVEALAHDWGSDPVHGGKRVWAELRADGTW